jgi:hypothetical protein
MLAVEELKTVHRGKRATIPYYPIYIKYQSNKLYLWVGGHYSLFMNIIM